MKAVQISTYGGTDVLEVKDVTSSSPKEGQVAVAVHVAGINPFDVKILSGAYQNFMKLSFPMTMGGDFAGTISDSGEEVYGTATVPSGGSGSYAQIAVANSANIAPKPKKASFEEAAALPVVGCSVVSVLEKQIKLSKGQKILIHGGAGGIGHLAIQLAKSMGGYVATTVSADDVDFVKGLGADEAVDYKNQKFEEKLREFEAVFDTVGGQTMTRSFSVLKKGGILVSMLGKPDEELGKKFGVTVVGQATQIVRENLMRVSELVDNGIMKVHVDRVFPLEEVREAFEYQLAGHPRGKVVLTVKG